MSVVQMNNSSNEQSCKRTIVQTGVVQMIIHRIEQHIYLGFCLDIIMKNQSKKEYLAVSDACVTKIKMFLN